MLFERAPHVGRVDEPCEQYERRVTLEFVLVDQDLEGALVTSVSVRSPRSVKTMAGEFRCSREQPGRCGEHEFGFGVDEVLDESGASETVDLRTFAGGPFHDGSLRACIVVVVRQSVISAGNWPCEAAARFTRRAQVVGDTVVRCSKELTREALACR